jgi:hypothetical protein
MKCKFCPKICKNPNSLRQHQIRCKHNPDRRSLPIPTNKGNKGRNQFSKAKDENRVVIISEETRKKLSKASKGRKLSKETKDKIRKSMQLAVEKYPESYSWGNISKRIRRYEYYDSFGEKTTLVGSWEKCVAEALDQDNIKWIRPKKGFKYMWEDHPRTYFPDFYLPDYDLYVEVKGKERDRDLKKYDAVSNLVVWRKKEVEEIKRKNSTRTIIKPLL